MKELWLYSIKLTHFKNYTTQTFHLDKKMNGFVGLNGMGKTNLLDAVFYACSGKSKFGAPDKLILQKASPFFRLEASFLLDNQPETIVAKVMPQKSKELLRNDIPYQKLSEHLGLLPVVFCASDDIALITEGSEDRRRFVDNILAQTDRDYLNALVQYQSILKQRNALLKNIPASNFYNLLEIYAKQLIQPGKLIFDKRTSFTSKLSELFQHHYNTISGAAETVSISYESQLQQDTFEALLSNCTEKDVFLQRSTVGIHKDDWSFQIDESPIKRFGSQGQLKSFALALKLAEFFYIQQILQKTPILILDDIFDKLDEHRVNHLLSIVMNPPFGQILISDTHLERVRKLSLGKYPDGKFYQIANGSGNLL